MLDCILPCWPKPVDYLSSGLKRKKKDYYSKVVKSRPIKGPTCKG